MAGIGFQLRKLARQDTISSILAAAGHAAMIAAGPWLFTIVALASITIATDRITGATQLASFRGIVIYAFAISLIFAAPIVIVATRLAGDLLWSKRPDLMRGLMLGAFNLVLLPTTVGVLLAVVVFGLKLHDALTLAAMTGVVSMIWVAITFCGAVRDYRGVSTAFVGGLLIALIACVVLAVNGFESLGMAWGFTAGLMAVLFGLTSRVFATFPHAVTEPAAGTRALLVGLRRYWVIAMGAFIGTLGIWIDKAVFWFSSVSEALDNGLRHAPLYDSTLFIASLILVPALASFVIKLETGFFERYQRYYATIGSHGTLAQIEAARVRLARYTMDSLTLITLTLAGLASILLLTAPIIVEAIGLQYRQIAILRYGALGTLFQFVFIAASSMLLFFDRRGPYLLAQILYCVANGGLAAVSLALGEDYYGTGFFVAALLSAAVAFVLTDSVFQKLNFLTFIGNNPSVRGASRR